ncbi:hypothetical protein AMS68_005549 [Peltaster fructicola]|uniref:Uncharacterized protein n=1 Tax=Peltaster fructicola TaxID=286661 RepID=A0A6H0XZ33_9PEZI|nr:hypothetical protein AMS68_005549 [Peltaster fructicola]
MATTHVVSLFLPYTAHFHEKEERKHSPAQRTLPGHPPLLSRHSIDITKRGSAVSLFGDDAPDILSDGNVATELFAKFAQDMQRQLPITPGNPRSLMRSDAHVPDWGKQAIFNQPRSRAGPLPSGSILDFAKVHEELQRKPKASRSAVSALTSRKASSEGTFDSKTWTIETALQGNGGLANAMRESSSDTLADITWHGTLDFPTDSLPESLKEDIADHLANEYQAQVVYVSDKNFQGHYAGYCKTILWPIFHYQVPDHPKSRAYADHSWKFYSAVNQAFADRVVENYKRGDIIWIHDYHLLLVPKMIRERLPNAQIGFFLHTAFPSSEVFRCLVMRTELLEGMLGANLIAFQVDEYAEHFLQTCSRILTVETTSQGVQLDDHFVNVISKPIGINLEAVNEQRASTEVREWIAKISEKYAGKRVIVARDKLDGISGVRHKLLSYELFLNKNPEWREKIVLIQVATSTSEQAELMATVSDIVTRIESMHSTLAHQPLVFLKQDIPFSQYLALLSIADILIVGSLRDGMNLTAHDYVICQDGKYCEKKYGSLILSEFTGSAALFGDHVLSINPWAYEDQCTAITRAFEMSDAEKKDRWTHLHDIVLKHSGGKWAKSLAESLRQVHEEHAAHDTTSIPRLSLPQVSTAYKASERRVFILDYEGTLAPHRTQTGITLGSPQRVIDALGDLIQDQRNLVYVMSGRMPDELDNHFKTVPKLGLIAENGCFMREAGVETSEWTSYPDMDTMEGWKNDVKGILRYYIERMEGTYLEERHCSLLLRFEKCEDKEAAARMVGECADHINGAFNKTRIHAVPINQAILIETLDYSKGFAAAKILDHLRADQSKNGVDFLLIAGDDREDESIFRWANDLGKQEAIKHVFTISVGRRNTEAQATLTQGTSGLLTTLIKLAKISAAAQPEDYFNVKSRA